MASAVKVILATRRRVEAAESLTPWQESQVELWRMFDFDMTPAQRLAVGV